MANGAQELNPTVEFVAGTLGGIAGLVAGFPFDTGACRRAASYCAKHGAVDGRATAEIVKVRLQTPELAGHYRGSTARAIATIVREERVVGLYKGITSPLLAVALMNGLVFASYAFFLRLQHTADAGSASLVQVALAGVGSGVVSAAITTPTELIKIRQQQCTGATASAWAIARAAGVRGLYRGAVATALRDCGYGAYFAAYEATARALASPGARAGKWEVLVAGGVAGVVGWLVTFPLDVVKTRVQGSGPGVIASASTTPLLAPPAKNPYNTTWSTVVHSYRAEGFRVFYRGLAPTLIRAVPVNMVTFGVFEAVVGAWPWSGRG
ncbi:carnitine/acyl carnitine carrier [Mycena latifolia]|nr:carnitine/acyl carnitine carrier [Mycena latifolia]